MENDNNHLRLSLIKGFSLSCCALTALFTIGEAAQTAYPPNKATQFHPNLVGRTNIYSLGIMVFQLLTGALPFQHQNPGSLLHAIQRALEQRSEDRLATSGEFIHALR